MTMTIKNSILIHNNNFFNTFFGKVIKIVSLQYTFDNNKKLYKNIF